MSVQELLGGMVVSISASMAEFVECSDRSLLTSGVEAETGTSRSIFELAEECISTHRYLDIVLTTNSPTPPARESVTASVATVEDCRKQLLESSSNLQRTIANMSDADLIRVYRHPRGDIRGLDLIIGAYRNTAYHCGQINLLQILGGDSQFHAPSNWYPAEHLAE